MPATTWNRQVSLGSDGTLQVSIPDGGNPPGHDDPPSSITVDANSLPATIRYTGIGGVRLHKIRWDGDHTGVTGKKKGGTLIVEEGVDCMPGSTISYVVIDREHPVHR